MSEFAKAVERMVRAEVGDHSWRNVPGREEHVCKTECGLPRDYDEAQETIERVRARCSDLLVVALRPYDASRVMLEAQQRHLALDHEDDPESAFTWTGGAYAGACDKDVLAAMLRDDSPGYRVEWGEWEFPDDGAAYQRLRARLMERRG